MARETRSWSAVRFWLFDLVRELEASVADRDVVALDPEHVWITRSGRAILLDFRCPGLPARGKASIGPVSRVEAREADAFVRRFVEIALGPGAAGPRRAGVRSAARADALPLHARTFLRRLDERLFPNLKATAAALHETLGRRALLTRNRRAAHVALCALVPACALVAAMVSAVIRGEFTVGGIIAPLAGALAFTLNLAVWSAAWFRGGFMLRVFDIAVVTEAGEEVSRQRGLLRAMVAWSPCLFFLLATLSGGPMLGLAALVIMVGGAAMALVAPERGLQDRIVRTSLVPR
jgi:hypothetical protein